jgi:hypothetical protein
MPIGRRQYQMAVALPGQRMSYQDNTTFKGYFDECINNETFYLPFGRFVVQLSNQPIGNLSLPSTTAAPSQKIVGINPIQGCWEASSDGVVGIPPKHPMSYAHEGIFAIETSGTLTLGGTFAIAAADADAANKGKLVDSTAYVPAKATIPTNFRVVRILPYNLAIVEISFPTTLIQS